MTRSHIWSLLGCLTLGALVAGVCAIRGVADGAEPTRSEVNSGENADVEVQVHRIVPDLRSIQIGGQNVSASREEMKVLSVLHDGPGSPSKACIVSVTLRNAGSTSYLLSDADVRAILVHGAVFVDEHAREWTLRYTVRFACDRETLYTVPCVAGVDRSFDIHMGLSELVPVTSTGAEAEGAFPKTLDYKIKANTKVAARDIAATPSTQGISIRVVGEGRCLVDVNGGR